MKHVLPESIINRLKELREQYMQFLFYLKLNMLRRKQKEIVKKVASKKVKKVLFLVIHDSIWKYDLLYSYLQQDVAFEPIVVVVPLVRNGEAQMENYKQTLSYFKNEGYNTFSSYDADKNTWLDIKEILAPDLVFFTNPHPLTFDKYYISHFLDCLTCYVPYAFVVIHLLEYHYNQPFQKLLWKYFLETKNHFNLGIQFQETRKHNLVITGFPGLDKKISGNYNFKNPWKIESNFTRKIIWAPHHTIEKGNADLQYSSFETYASFFLKLIQENRFIQIAFKPHPLLKEKLYEDTYWGKEKTDAYYTKWNSLPNGQLEEGEYIGLFEYSDALILDSASFIAEYLYFRKPLLFTKNDQQVEERFNSFGKKIFSVMYHGYNVKDINNFIQEVVFDGKDSLQEKRNKFLEEEILPDNKKLASENIYEILRKELC